VISLRKFLTSIKFSFFIVILVAIGVITIGGNVFIAANKRIINQTVKDYFTYRIEISRIIYAFPNYIILKDIVFDKLNKDGTRLEAVLPGVAVRFSFMDYIFNQSINVSEVTLYPSTVNYFVLSEFLEENLEKIIELIRSSPEGDIKIRIKESLLDFDREGQPDYIAMELLLRIRGEKLEGTGFFRADQYSTWRENGVQKLFREAKGWPLWYGVKGDLKPDGFQAEYLIIKSGNLYSKLWGSFRGGLLKINGFAFMDTARDGSQLPKYKTADYFKEFSEKQDLANIDLYILDIDGRMRLAFPDIYLENVQCTYNNKPVSLQGKVSLLNPLTYEVGIRMDSDPALAEAKSLFKRADAHMSGIWKDNILRANGRVHFDFIKADDHGLSPESADASLNGLSYYFDEHRRPTLLLSEADISYLSNNNKHKLKIENLKFAANVKMAGLKVVEVSSPFYHGDLDGHIWIDSVQNPPKITSLFVLTDVDTDALEELLVHFGKFNGRMSSRLKFSNLPQMDLSGEINIYDGRLTDFNFFNWVADSFRLTALKSIDFGRASAQFSITKERVQLHDIRLETDDVQIGGYYDIDDKNLISSRLSLNLSQRLLEESPKFRPVLKLFEDDEEYLNFDFQLSGAINNINFQWLPSEVKRKIQTRIPDFVERMIERNVDRIREAPLEE